MNTPLDIAVVGATGALGRVLLEVLGDSRFPLGRLYPLASERAETEGDTLTFRNRELTVGDAEGFDFSRAQLVLLAVPADCADSLAADACAAGAAVLDFSSAQRNNPAQVLAGGQAEGPAPGQRVRCPDGLSLAVASLLEGLTPAGVESVDITALLPAGVHGRAAMDELAGQTTALFNLSETTTQVFDRRLAFNLLPASLDEHQQRSQDVARLLGDAAPTVALNLAVAPVFFGASLSLTLHGSALDEAAVRAAWAANTLIRLDDDSAVLSPADAATRPDLAVAGLHRQGDALCAWAAFDPLRWVALHALRLSARTLASLQQPA